MARVRHPAPSLERFHGYQAAIVAGNDEIAVGVLAAAKELGVSVPGELSVTGFDDTPQTQWTTPRLTSVQPASRHLQLATTLGVRDSTGPVPSS